MLDCNRYGTHIKFIKLYNFDTMQAGVYVGGNSVLKEFVLVCLVSVSATAKANRPILF